MYDVVCVGTTAVDMYFKGPALHEKEGHFQLVIGGKYFTDFFYEGVGGGATNVAIGLAKQNIRSVLYSEIGQNSFKRFIFEKLEAHAIPVRHCVLSHDYHNISTVLLTTDGERTVINHRTHRSTFLHTLPEQSLFTGAQMLYMGNLAYVSEWHRARLLRHAKHLNLTTVITLGAEECRKSYSLIDDILKYTDILVINEHECADLLRAHVEKIVWSEPLHASYSHVPLPSTVIVTRGARGATAYVRGESPLHQPAIPVTTIIDSSGAGDGFVAGFIQGYLKHKHDLKVALEHGAAYAAKKLQHLGAN